MPKRAEVEIDGRDVVVRVAVNENGKRMGRVEIHPLTGIKWIPKNKHSDSSTNRCEAGLSVQELASVQRRVLLGFGEKGFERPEWFRAVRLGVK
ncbi:hypothetical protein [Anaeromyxobacter oryzae]|uniref:Uncharacterized protein n=1 Tax=Anaeromyxobacter oryzae TaxID=2918170 RepID=A0ABM7WTP5_9BACT|nr:hypothetical protein [Anaeromyxobacter oryzae]BDG02839.1 hypothetical protein AMOR_18350 [Anaeromyxobacter oryzae]